MRSETVIKHGPEGFAGNDTNMYDVPADFDDNEDVGNDIGRRERMAEAMYEC